MWMRSSSPHPHGFARTEPTARDRAVGVALDVDDLAVLDIDALGAPDRAVGADRHDDPVGVLGARPQRGGVRGAHRPSQAQRVALGELAQHRPPPKELERPERAEAFTRFPINHYRT